MIPTHALHAIDKLLRDITRMDIPFGGKIMLLGMLPIVPRSPPAVIIEVCLKSSELSWPLFRQVHLTKNMRADADEQDFAR